MKTKLGQRKPLGHTNLKPLKNAKPKNILMFRSWLKPETLA